MAGYLSTFIKIIGSGKWIINFGKIITMINRIFLFLILVTCFGFNIYAQKEAYQIFDKNGKKSSYNKLLKNAGSADIVLFGELHNNPINHWLQLELVKDLHKNHKVIIGAEMFEADNQQVLSNYLENKITEKEFKENCRLWPNYQTDYKPVVEYAKENGIKFIASNIPRKYASLVYKNGFEALDTLDNESKQFIVPLPFEYDSSLNCYRNILQHAGGHGGSNLPKSQAIKDATMAYFILKNFDSNFIFIHLNGTYHSNNFESIYWYLKKKKPDIKILTIGSVEQADISKLMNENIKIADFIICTPETMGKTY
jgi:uncharacterized iron-regulated protein